MAFRSNNASDDNLKGLRAAGLCEKYTINMQEIFGADIGKKLELFALSIGTTPTMLYPALLCAFGAAAGSNAILVAEATPKIRPNLYMLLVCVSGAGKSPVLDFVLKDLLKHVETIIKGQVIIPDTGRAGLIDCMSKCRNAGVILADEAYEILDKFVSADPSTSAKDVLNTMFNSTSYDKHTVTRGTTSVREISLSFSGGIQPGPFISIVKKLQMRFDGFDYRWLVFPSKCEVVSQVDKRNHSKELHLVMPDIMATLKDALTATVLHHNQVQEYTPDDDAQSEFDDFDQEYTLQTNLAYQAGVHNEDDDPANINALTNMSSKFNTLVQKLALNIHLVASAVEAAFSGYAETASFDRQIKVQSVKAAIESFKLSENVWLEYRTKANQQGPHGQCPEGPDSIVGLLTKLTGPFYTLRMLLSAPGFRGKFTSGQIEEKLEAIQETEENPAPGMLRLVSGIPSVKPMKVFFRITPDRISLPLLQSAKLTEVAYAANFAAQQKGNVSHFPIPTVMAQIALKSPYAPEPDLPVNEEENGIAENLPEPEETQPRASKRPRRGAASRGK